jgi:3-phenylpropionate/trans-cinnamate dioxygenase ferredoxin subunit
MNFIRACTLSDVPEEGVVSVTIQDVPVAIIKVRGELHAIHDSCTHADVPLSEGEIYDGAAECWLHGSRFDLRTGKATFPPATEAVAVYPTRIQADEVYVKLPREQ